MFTILEDDESRGYFFVLDQNGDSVMEGGYFQSKREAQKRADELNYWAELEKLSEEAA